MSMDNVMDKILYKFRTSITPTITSVGILGNIVAIVLLIKLEKKSSVSTYVTALASAETLYLLSYKLNWIYFQFTNQLLNSRAELCQLAGFLDSSATFLVNWFMMLLCFNRLVFYWSSATYVRSCTRMRAVVVVLVVVTACVVINLNFAVTLGVDDSGKCVIMSAHPLVMPQLKIAAEAIIINLIPCVAVPLALLTCFVQRACSRPSNSNPAHQDNFGLTFVVISVAHLLYIPLSLHRLSVVYRAITDLNYLGITNRNEWLTVAIIQNLSKLSLSVFFPTLLFWKPFRAQIVKYLLKLWKPFRAQIVKCFSRGTETGQIGDSIEMKESVPLKNKNPNPNT